MKCNYLGIGISHQQFEPIDFPIVKETVLQVLGFGTDILIEVISVSQWPQDMGSRMILKKRVEFNMPVFTFYKKRPEYKRPERLDREFLITNEVRAIIYYDYAGGENYNGPIKDFMKIIRKKHNVEERVDNKIREYEAGIHRSKDLFEKSIIQTKHGFTNLYSFERNTFKIEYEREEELKAYIEQYCLERKEI